MVITVGIINILYSGEDLAEKRNVCFSNCFTIHVETLDKGTVLQASYNETNWVIVTNKYCCRSIGVKCSTKYHVGSDCCQNLLAKTVFCVILVIGHLTLTSVSNGHVTVFCVTFVIGHLTLTSVSNVHVTDFP